MFFGQLRRLRRTRLGLLVNGPAAASDGMTTDALTSPLVEPPVAVSRCVFTSTSCKDAALLAV